MATIKAHEYVCHGFIAIKSLHQQWSLSIALLPTPLRWLKSVLIKGDVLIDISGVILYTSLDSLDSVLIKEMSLL